MGWTDTEPYGTRFYETPNIAMLAKDAVRFTNAYAASPVCSPTRVSILTGKYPSRLHNTDWFGAPQPEAVINDPKLSVARPLLPAHFSENLSLSEFTLAEAFKQNGYTTFIAGKWHLGESEQYWPEQQGFDVNKGGFSAGGPPSYFAPYKNPRLTDGPAGEYLPERLARETNQFLEQNKERPFFAFFSLYAVHTPLQARQELIEKYQRKRDSLGLIDSFGMEGQSKVRTVQSNPVYAAMVESMDAAVGQVIEQLKTLGLYEKTIILFFSDNGGVSIMRKGLDPHSCNLPLRGGKGWLYEGGIREPLIIRWPGHTAAGGVYSSLVMSTDFYPSLLEMAGLQLLPRQHLDGVSFASLLKGKRYHRGPVFWHYPHYSYQDGSPCSAIRSGSWKLLRWYEDDREELYNLDTDIGEKNNLVRDHSRIARRLRKQLEQWLNDQHASLPEKNPHYKPTIN